MSETFHIRCDGGPFHGQEFDVEFTHDSPYLRMPIDMSGVQRTAIYQESYRYGVGMDRTKSGYGFEFVGYEDERSAVKDGE